MRGAGFFEGLLGARKLSVGLATLMVPASLALGFTATAVAAPAVAAPAATAPAATPSTATPSTASPSTATASPPAGPAPHDTILSCLVVAGNCPRVDALEPDSGPTTGGTTVRISGSDLEGMSAGAVYFGSVKGRVVEEECGGICDISPYTMLTVESPPHAAETVDVTLENARGEMSAINPGDRFTFAPPGAGRPTEVVTGPAEPGANGYLLKGKLNPDGLPTTYYFEYIGSDEAECLDGGLIDCWPNTPHAGPVEGDVQQEVAPIELTKLTVGASYSYRLVATNADGTAHGELAKFTVTTTGGPSGAGKEHVSEAPHTSSEPTHTPVPVAVSSPPPQKLASKPPVDRVTFKPRTRARELADALRECKRKPRKHRASCERLAHRRYGAALRLREQARK